MIDLPSVFLGAFGALVAVCGIFIWACLIQSGRDAESEAKRMRGEI